MADNKTKKQLKTVKDYGLRRVSCPFDDETIQVSFIEPYISEAGQPPTADWESFKVMRHENVPVYPGQYLSWYAVSRSRHAHVTLFVQLAVDEEKGARRLTEMRYRAMALDDVRATGGGGRDSMRELQFLGISQIINRYAFNSIAEAFRRAGRSIMDDGAVEVTPDGADGGSLFRECLQRNPFARCQHGMLERYSAETGGAFIKRFIFISNNRYVYMVTELGRPVDRILT